MPIWSNFLLFSWEKCISNQNWWQTEVDLFLSSIKIFHRKTKSLFSFEKNKKKVVSALHWRYPILVSNVGLCCSTSFRKKTWISSCYITVTDLFKNTNVMWWAIHKSEFAEFIWWWAHVEVSFKICMESYSNHFWELFATPHSMLSEINSNLKRICGFV